MAPLVSLQASFNQHLASKPVFGGLPCADTCPFCRLKAENKPRPYMTEVAKLTLGVQGTDSPLFFFGTWVRMFWGGIPQNGLSFESVWFPFQNPKTKLPRPRLFEQTKAARATPPVPSVPPRVVWSPVVCGTSGDSLKG